MVVVGLSEFEASIVRMNHFKEDRIRTRMKEKEKKWKKRQRMTTTHILAPQRKLNGQTISGDIEKGLK